SASGLRLDPLLFERLVYAAPEFVPQPVQGTVNPRVIASQVLEGRKSSCHRGGVLRESSASNRDEPRPVLHPRVCAGHDLLEAADDAYRKSSPYYLPQSRQVRFHPVVLLGPSNGQSEPGDYLVECEKDIVFRRQLTKSLEVPH